MIINCFYDEDMSFADIVYIPNHISFDAEMEQEIFLDWLFNDESDHNYWIFVGGEKVACNYGTQAFIDWINEKYFLECEEKAYMLEENAEKWDDNNKSLVF